jgi:hypothetical protein
MKYALICRLKVHRRRFRIIIEQITMIIALLMLTMMTVLPKSNAFAIQPASRYGLPSLMKDEQQLQTPVPVTLYLVKGTGTRSSNDNNIPQIEDSFTVTVHQYDDDTTSAGTSFDTDITPFQSISNMDDALLPKFIIPTIVVVSIISSLMFADAAHATVAFTASTSIQSSTPPLPSLSLAASAATTTTSLPLDWNKILNKATTKALGGGQAGALAAIVQVCTLMWLRTCMNYQYRYGGTLMSSLRTLWGQGGISRLYQGLPFAIIQGPLTRFGDTAANVGILSLLESIPITQSLPLPIKTLCGSITAGLWRIILMPIDTSKTSLQVEGSIGLQKLWNTTLLYGPGVLYRGSLAQAAATAVGHFPWFLTYNFFNDILPVVDTSSMAGQVDPNLITFLSLGRSALLGLLASCVSDCSSNSLRVIKTTKQTAQLNDSTVVDPNSNNTRTKDLTYKEVVQLIIDQDGIIGLFGRGLQTRLLTNAIQGAMFSVLWKYFQQQLVQS